MSKVSLSVLVVERVTHREGVGGTHLRVKVLVVAHKKCAVALFARWFVEIAVSVAVVACRRNDYAPWSHHVAKHLEIEHVVAIEIGIRAFAERNDTRLALLGGIVKDVLEAQSVGGRRVFFLVKTVHENHVFANGVAYQTKVALEGHTPIGTVVACSCGNVKRMGSMCLYEAVARMFASQNVLFVIVGTPHIHRSAAQRIFGQLIPKALDTEMLERGIAPRRMGEVETDVHQPHHHALAGIGLREMVSLMQLPDLRHLQAGVHRRSTRHACFNAFYLRFTTKSSQTVKRNMGDVYVAKLCQRLASVGAQKPLAIALHTNKSAKARPTVIGRRCLPQSCSTLRLTGCQANQRRHLGKLRTLRPQRHHRKNR